MFLVLTALAILPADFTNHGLAGYGTALGMRTRQFELLIQKTQRDVDQMQKELPRRPGLQPILKARLDDLDELRMKMGQAQLTELRSSPFASAVWWVKDVPKK